MTTPHMSDAAVKLAASRERLKQVLSGRSTTRPAAGTPNAARAEMATPDDLLLVKHAVGVWWANHPLHLAAGLAGSVVHTAVAPIAHKHPVRLLLASAAVGGLITYLRPWRLLAGTGLVAVWLPKLVGKAAVWAATVGAPAPPPEKNPFG